VAKAGPESGFSLYEGSSDRELRLRTTDGLREEGEDEITFPAMVISQ